MAFTLRIDTGNAAFADEETGEEAPAPELARILRSIADRLDVFMPCAAKGVPVLDVNGNTVGRFFYAQEDDELLERVARGIAVARVGYQHVPAAVARLYARAALDAIAR